MTYSTQTEKPKARKAHVCMSCGEAINVGDTYHRWRSYDGRDAGTVKMHPECHKAHDDDSIEFGGGTWEFTPYSHPRGMVD